MKLFDPQSKIQSLIQGKTVLHCGCAEAGDYDIRANLSSKSKQPPQYWFQTFLEKHAKQVLGIDLDDRAIQEMKKKGLSVQKHDAYTFSTKKKFDVIIATKIFNHLTNPGLFLESISRALKKDGIIIIQTPNATSAMRIGALIFRSTDKYDYSNPDHVQIHTRLTLSHLLEKHGFFSNEKYYLVTSKLAKAATLAGQFFADDLFFVARLRHT